MVGVSSRDTSALNTRVLRHGLVQRGVLDVAPGASLGTTRAKPRGRYLVGDGSLDALLGYVATADLLKASLSGAPLALRALVREPLLAPETLPPLALQERFRTERTHAAAIDGHRAERVRSGRAQLGSGSAAPLPGRRLTPPRSARTMRARVARASRPP